MCEANSCMAVWARFAPFNSKGPNAATIEATEQSWGYRMNRLGLGFFLLASWLASISTAIQNVFGTKGIEGPVPPVSYTASLARTPNLHSRCV